ncbi:MAG: hypothetical protein IJ796_02490 [Lachnospiraceae bacterium]|nr:hypothetical protein [Lachnospiraceae bacterium]
MKTNIFRKKINSRAVSLTAAAVVLFVMFFSVFFIASEAHHECSGEDCAICDVIAVCESTIRQIGGARVFAITALFAAVTALLSIGRSVDRFVFSTPVSVKVRLNN